MSVHETALLLLVLAATAAVALAVEPSARRLGVPLPLVFLVLGYLLGEVWPLARHDVGPAALAPLGTVALVVILLDGGLASGWRALRGELVGVIGLGLGATLFAFFVLAAATHALTSFGWTASFLVGAALAPTDPAAVFSVLPPAMRGGRLATVLEGEAGFNDPVSIALALGLLDAVTNGHEVSVLELARRLVTEGVVGAVAGVLVALAVTRVLGPRWPTVEAAPGLTVLAVAFAVYGGTTLLHGSGFLAVYLYALVVADRVTLPDRDRVFSLHAELAGLAEIGMFVLLGIAIDGVDLSSALGDGIALGAAMIVFARPPAVFPALRAFRFSRGEAAFGAYAGLKGAVPILLGSLPYAAGVANGREEFTLVAVVVLVSLVAQGMPLGRVGRALGVVPPGG